MQLLEQKLDMGCCNSSMVTGLKGYVVNIKRETIKNTDFRHWKATMEYHKTKDILHVKKLLGHKKIENTEFYINIEQALFQTQNDEFHVKTALTPEEIKSLLEVGFEYICEKDGLLFFRKRK
jgi:hypothetical protein